MFGFFKKKKPAPETCPSNPGVGIEANIGFTNGDRSWSEKVNLVDIAATVFKKHRHAISNETTCLHHAASGFLFLPQLAELVPMDDGSVRTVTTMQINHPTLVPKGIFEYQHSAGDNAEEAIFKGFDQWVQTDLPPLMDALRSKPESCTAMEMEFPASDGKAARVRRVVLGPIAHFMQTPPASLSNQAPDDHPFCPCCLLTRSFEAFKELLEGDSLFALRFFAARNEEGNAAADCRVNGEDWEQGAEALREYVKTWPAAGYEFRKQYVAMQTIQKSS